MLAHSHSEIKAACISALCSDLQKRLNGPDKLVLACADGSSHVREEARRALALWTQA